MRRVAVLLMLVTGILTIIIGIVEAQAWHTGPAVAHIVIASIFVALCLLHICLNRKAVLKYVFGGKR